jgi:catechol 2,3-dioxygenase-like lactoylglutathione lyase family enzyme
MPREWPESLPAVQFRIARPTAQLEQVTAFYRDGLGLPIIYCYEQDADFDGVIFGLPGRGHNLEITRHSGDGPCPLPAPDNLLVFYLPDKTIFLQVAERLGAMGYVPVAPRNPYWAEKGLTFADPDGWHIVIMNTAGFGPDIE